MFNCTIRKISRVSQVTVTLVLIGSVGSHVSTGNESAAQPMPKTIRINISPDKPTDLPDLSGRENHTLSEAAVFAWQQFIAHTWPAMPQTGAVNSRDQPDVTLRYGQKGRTGQVVWETYRHKSELNPGMGAPNGEPNGFINDPAMDFGYDSLPKYYYSFGEVKPASGQTVTDSPFDNLDEVNEILLCDMSAGVSGARILYQAKVNRVIYKYSSQHQLFKGSILSPGIMRANAAYNLHVTDPTKLKEPYVELPSSDPSRNAVGSIEAKSAWRKLAADEDPSRFYTNRVRFYVLENGELRYKEETWGLVALHIIHKTASSPVFVYTSFSQIDNIRAIDGTVVEEPDGTVKSEYRDIPPFAPELQIYKSDPTRGQEVFVVQGSPGLAPNSKQLFYQNIFDKKHGITVPVAVRRRLYEIPSEIRAVNRIAQNTIRAYDPKAVWQYYKLVNVQSSTLRSFVDRAESDQLSLDDKASFFMANEVVETNVPLQQFSGTLSPGDNHPSGKFAHAGNYDFGLFDEQGQYDPMAQIVSEKKSGEPINNVYLHTGAPKGEVWRKLNMGGCVGCHGPQGQLVGGDFSVLIARGRVSNPETIEDDGINSIRLLEHLETMKPKK
ncbi:hypothetical protein ACC719_13765 [Rhizobium ruizarguesonis]